MIKGDHLRLIYSKPQSKIKQLWEWFNKARLIEIEIPTRFKWWTTDEEKAETLKAALTEAFADYDYTTQEVNIYPSIRAEDAVNKMIEDKTLDYYFKRHKMTRVHLQKLDKIEAQFNRRKA